MDYSTIVDVDHEIRRVESLVQYHLSEAEYFQTVLGRLRSRVDRERDIEFFYEGVDETVSVARHEWYEPSAQYDGSVVTAADEAAMSELTPLDNEDGAYLLYLEEESGEEGAHEPELEYGF